MGQVYKENFTVKWHQIDAAKELRYYSFMNVAQEVANMHSELLHFGYDELIAENNIWVLSRVHIKYINPPKWKDKLCMETWHKGRSGLFWIRDFKLSYLNGDIAALATSSWLIINTQTRKIERNTIFDNKPIITTSELKQDAISEQCAKLVNSQNNLDYISEHVVKYSDIDFNLHANNAKYIEWAIDSIPIEILKNKKIKELKLNFITEAKFKDVIKIYASISPNEIYLQGCRDKEILFNAIIYF